MLQIAAQMGMQGHQTRSGREVKIMARPGGRRAGKNLVAASGRTQRVFAAREHQHGHAHWLSLTQQTRTVVNCP